MAEFENIKIFNSEFSLGDIPDINEVIPDMNEIIPSSSNIDYMNYINYIYIAIAIVSFVLIFFIYKYFVNREKKVTFQDKLDKCYGDVCYR